MKGFDADLLMQILGAKIIDFNTSSSEYHLSRPKI